MAYYFHCEATHRCANSSLPPTRTQSASTSNASQSNTASSSSSHIDAGVIAGPVAGGIILIALIVGVFFWTRRKSTPVQEIIPVSAPYYESYSRPNILEKRGQTILSPPPTVWPGQAFQSSGQSAYGGLTTFDPYSSEAPTQSSTQLLHTAPLPLPQSPPPSQPQQPVDIDRIVELIAQRIDRPPPNVNEAPPRYPM